MIDMKKTTLTVESFVTNKAHGGKNGRTTQGEVTFSHQYCTQVTEF